MYAKVDKAHAATDVRSTGLDKLPKPARPASEHPVDRKASRVLRELFEARHQSVYNFFANRGFSGEDCRDLTQETFLAAFASHFRFRREAQIETWLFSIMKNVWRRAVRDRNRAKRKGTEVPLAHLSDSNMQQEWDISIKTGEDQPLAQVLVDERAQLVRQAMSELPDTMRTCTLLRVDQEMGHQEIALTMKMSVSAVKSQLHRARLKLRSRLSVHFDEDG